MNLVFEIFRPRKPSGVPDWIETKFQEGPNGHPASVSVVQNAITVTLRASAHPPWRIRDADTNVVLFERTG